MFMLYLPFAIQFLVNTLEIPELEDLMNKACKENCTLKTRVLDETPNGRNLFVEIFKSLLRSTPDYMIVIKSSKLCLMRRTLVLHAISHGTVLRRDRSEYLYNTITHGQRGVVNMALKHKAEAIVRNEGFYFSKTETIMKFLLTRGGAYITKIYISTNVVEVIAVDTEALKA